MQANRGPLISILGAALALAVPAMAEAAPFRWGASSAAYQVEGAVEADGRGKSVWDVYLHDEQLAGPGVTGDTAINFYDRKQYLKDIQLFKQMGLTSYRFSISWPRIIPDGTGKVNQVAVDHYRQFIDDLRAAGIEPMVTLYHWDMPAELARQGGWDNRKSIEWFDRYARVVFDNFHDKADLFVLVNEPLVENAYTNAVAERRAGRSGELRIIPDAEYLGVSLRRFNHILLAAAAAKRSFEEKGYQGDLGIAVPLFPVLTDKGAGPDDVAAAKLADGVLNRWFLDALYFGKYPDDILAAAKSMGLDTDVQPGDAATVAAAELDYLGINYYAPVFVRQAPGTGPYRPESFVPEGVETAQNGPNRPDQFTALLDRIRTQYGNPPIYITENGAGFTGDDELVDGQVNDVRRCAYIANHIAAMQLAMRRGADVRGYHVWSSHDNLEWLFGYGARFGMVYVDFDTQQRIPKLSSKVYAQIIETGKPDTAMCTNGAGSRQ